MSRKNKAKKNSSAAEPKLPRRRLAGRSVKVLAVLCVAAGGAVGMVVLRSRVLSSHEQAAAPVRVVLARSPENLPRDVPAGVVADVQAKLAGRGVLDADLARDVYRAAAEHPWVAQVRRVVKGPDGRAVLEVDFRHPFALAATDRSPGEFRVVDEAGVVLPLRADRIRPGAFIAVVGIGTDPPQPGQSWDAPDLADGLRLCRLLKGRPYESQITAVDVRNYNGRISPYEPHLRLYAQIGQGPRTAILFGRFPLPDGLDYCVDPRDKFARLDAYVAENGGQLAGLKEWIDLQHDELYVSVH